VTLLQATKGKVLHLLHLLRASSARGHLLKGKNLTREKSHCIYEPYGKGVSSRVGKGSFEESSIILPEEGGVPRNVLSYECENHLGNVVAERLTPKERKVDLPNVEYPNLAEEKIWSKIEEERSFKSHCWKSS